MHPGEKRGEVFEWRGARIVNDCYNSNPRALDAMVDALLAMPVTHDGRHIVVAGEMLELGPEGEALHRACGQRMARRGVDVVVGVRGLAAELVEGAARRRRRFLCRRRKRPATWLKANLRRGRCGAAEGIAWCEAGTRARFADGII